MIAGNWTQQLDKVSRAELLVSKIRIMVVRSWWKCLDTLEEENSQGLQLSGDLMSLLLSSS